MTQMICPDCHGYLTRELLYASVWHEEHHITAGEEWTCREHGWFRVGGKQEPIELPDHPLPAQLIPASRAGRRNQPAPLPAEAAPRPGAQAGISCKRSRDLGWEPEEPKIRARLGTVRPDRAARLEQDAGVTVDYVRDRGEEIRAAEAAKRAARAARRLEAVAA